MQPSKRRSWQNVWSEGDPLSGVGGFLGFSPDSHPDPPSSARMNRYRIQRLALPFAAILLAAGAAGVLVLVAGSIGEGGILAVAGLAAATTLLLLCFLVAATAVDLLVVPLPWVGWLLRTALALTLLGLATIAAVLLVTGVAITRSPPSWDIGLGFWCLFLVALVVWGQTIVDRLRV